MKSDRFLNIYGWVLIGLSAGGLFFLFGLWSTESTPVEIGYFFITTSLWYFVTGMGILNRKVWGYYLLKSFLYMLLLSIPFGTFISYKSLKFMKDNSIKKEFST